MKIGFAVIALVASLSVAHAQGAAPVGASDTDTLAARQAVLEHDWPDAIADWEKLYVRGSPEAPAQLCALYFDARQGRFETGRVTDWCRRAAANNDAWSRYRMGLLYLVGLGVDRDVDQAQALCTAASRNPEIPVGFCLAAAYKEKERRAQEALLPVRPRPPAPAPVALDGTPQRTCDRAFTAPAFDAAAASEWCRKAAAAGDPEALYRLALMKLMGVGGPRDLDAAGADCARAAASGKPHTPTAFCLAAVAQLRHATARLAVSRHTGAIDADPTVGLSLPKTYADPYTTDRMLDAPHTTPTGLAYTCRQLSEWALYEAPGLTILRPSDTLFGRRIVAFRPADFLALDRAAVECARETAAADTDGSLAATFATFRKSLGALELRQAELRREERASRAEAAAIARVDETGRMSRVVMSINSTQEEACIGRVKRAWQASNRGNPRRALEIQDSTRAIEDGRYLAYGVANVVDTDSSQRTVLSVSMFRCTFDKGNGEIAKFELLPGFSSAR